MANWYFRNRQSGLVACPGCRNLVKAGIEFCPYCARRLGAEKGFRGKVKKLLTRDVIATRVIIGAIVVFFVIQFVVDQFIPPQYTSGQRGGFMFFLSSQPITAILLGSNYHPFVYYHSQIWRFVTSIFLHFGLIHILFNCWAFWDLGRLAEKFWGAKQVFAAFILSGAAGSAASFLWKTMVMGQPVNSAGASGAVCGILGLLLGAYYKDRRHIGEYLGAQLIRWAVMLLIFGLVAGADNGAHVGGFLAGAVMGFFLPPTTTSRQPARDRRIWDILAIVSLVVVIVAFVFGFVFALQGFAHVVTL